MPTGFDVKKVESQALAWERQGHWVAAERVVWTALHSGLTGEEYPRLAELLGERCARYWQWQELLGGNPGYPVEYREITEDEIDQIARELGKAVLPIPVERVTLAGIG